MRTESLNNEGNSSCRGRVVTQPLGDDIDGSNSEVVEEELTIRNESINIHEGDDIDGSWF